MDAGEETSTDTGSPEASPEAAAESGTDAGQDSAARDSSTDANVGDGGPPQPVALVTDAPNATMLATDGTSAYWIDWVAGDAGQHNGRVMKVGVAGGTETTLMSTPGVTPLALAIDTNNVYWTDDSGGLSQMAKTGTMGASLQGGGVGSPVAVSGGFVFFTSSTGVGVQKVPVDGGSVTTLATSGNPVDLIVVAGDVFWADATGHIAFVSASTGGTPMDLVGPDPEAGAGEYVSASIYQNIVTDGTSLYWPRASSGYPGAVMSIAVGGGAPQVVANIGTNSPASVATDGTSVYFLDVGASSSLAAASVGGGSLSTITTADMSAANVSGTPGPTVAVDSTSVYWLDPPQIVKIGK